MNGELYWLTLTALMTGLFWVPYTLNRFVELGIIAAVFQSNVEPEPKAVWAQRMMMAHRNAIENLVVFASLVLVVHVSGMSSETTILATSTYFFARATHYVIYTLGIPGLRTVTFLIGFACQMTLGFVLLGLL